MKYHNQNQQWWDLNLETFGPKASNLSSFIGPRPYWLIGRILNHNSVRLNATYGLAYRALVG